MDSPSYRRSVALTALNYWLPSWPSNTDEADQAHRAVGVRGWRWVHLQSIDQWEFQRKTDEGVQFITKNDWSPHKVEARNLG